MKNFKELALFHIVTLGVITFANPVFAQQDMRYVSDNIVSSIDDLPGLLTGISYLIGALLGVLGILKIRDHVESPGNTPLQHGMIRLAAGGGLFALPIVFEAMQSMIGTSGDLQQGDVSGVSYGPDGSCGGDQTLGEVICNLIYSHDNVPGLLTGFAYLFGGFLGIWGIMKLKDHVENPGQVPIWDPIKRFLAGGAFFALPTVMEAVQSTLDAGNLDAFTTNGFKEETSGTGLDAMMVKLVSDIWEPLLWLLISFSYLAGIVLVIIGISRFLKTEQEGARGPTGIGTIMTFLVAGALFSLPKMVGTLSTSLFETNVVTMKPELVYSPGLTGAEKAHAEAVIQAVVVFVAIIGWISIVRGFFIMRGVSEGSSQASMMAGMTHLIGGAIAVNLGPAMNAVQTTLDITEYGIFFS